MSNITEAEARESSGNELNKLVELWCKRDDLSCFEADGSERWERIAKATIGWFDDLLGVSHEEALCTFKSRHGKTYQTDLEAHVNNWRAKARDFEGDMNLAMGLWCDEFNRLYRHGGMWFVSIWKTYRIGDDRVFEAEEPAQAICRAAVIVAIRKRGE